jgi:hypothetical protein
MARVCRVCNLKESIKNPFRPRANLCIICSRKLDKIRGAGPYKIRHKQLCHEWYMGHKKEVCEKQKRKRANLKNTNPEKYKKHVIKEKSRLLKYKNRHSIYQKKYNSNHKKEIYEYRKNLNKSGNYKIYNLIRRRILLLLKSNKKSKHTLELIGCSLTKLKSHLQQTALKNDYADFDINNYNGNEYHIDHIIPASSFNLSNLKDQMICFNYKNLQILKKEENLKKWKFIKKRIDDSGKTVYY